MSSPGGDDERDFLPDRPDRNRELENVVVAGLQVCRWNCVVGDQDPHYVGRLSASGQHSETVLISTAHPEALRRSQGLADEAEATRLRVFATIGPKMPAGSVIL